MTDMKHRFAGHSAVLFLAASALYGQSVGTIITVAGNGDAGYTGDNVAATATALNRPVYVATDPAGNFYIADQDNNRIRKVGLQGQVTTVAGTGNASFSGDGGPATAADLNNPTGVYIDRVGDILIADVGNSRIRKVDTNGVITTVAGSGAQGYGGDGGPATSAQFFNPVRCISDTLGNIYIADQSNHRVRKVDASGIITTFAGTGVAGSSGDGGPATAAELDNPTAVAIDDAGYIYIADQFNHKIRKVDPSGVITTIAGTGQASFSGDGGPAIDATLNYPGSLIVDSSGNIFFCDDTNFRVREISAAGIINTIAGNGTQGFSGDGGPATSAELNGQFGIAIDPSGNVLIADFGNNRIRSIQGVSPVNPAFVSAAVTNAASFQTGGSAGALATIFGQHLSVDLNGIAGATVTPLPDTLANTSVTVNGTSAPMVAVVNEYGQEQINLQIPWELAGKTTASVVIHNGLAASTAVTVSLTAAQPGIFLLDGVNGAIEHLSGAVVSTSSPAVTGEYVTVFCTGLGAVNPAVADGVPASSNPLSYTTVQPSVTIGGTPVTVIEFSGLAPGFVGLNQLNIQVPANAASGAQDLVVTTGGISSNVAKIQVQ